jgi:hypothetical protein
MNTFDNTRTVGSPEQVTDPFSYCPGQACY